MKQHGISRIPEYKVWEGMCRRCLSPKSANWRFYGGRGISVCEEWRGPGGFERFIAHMGPRPDGHSIDRINYDGNYEPGNVRWLPNLLQHANTRSNRRITFNGETLHLTGWARRVGINADTLQARITDYGWSIERALTEPVN